jgi:hypothetical protein
MSLCSGSVGHYVAARDEALVELPGLTRDPLTPTSLRLNPALTAAVVRPDMSPE